MRILHAMRREMSRVLSDDYNGIRIQFQGDRVQAIFHLPKGDWRAELDQYLGYVCSQFVVTQGYSKVREKRKKSHL